ncbi:MAG: hypothetical protein ACXVBQ_04415 [Pseudobdellovibrionaceae bacterium]
MNQKSRCQNMNHNRTNAPVKFCPSCGEAVNKAASNSCDEIKHAARRKERNSFCHDCGKKLNKGFN